VRRAAYLRPETVDDIAERADAAGRSWQAQLRIDLEDAEAMRAGDKAVTTLGYLRAMERVRAAIDEALRRL